MYFIGKNMKPCKIVCFVIGEKLPEIVLHCLRNNKILCDIEKVSFEVIKLQRDYAFSCPGVQVDYEKIKFLSNNYNCMVIDYDIELFEIPDLKENENPLCGKWHNLMHDGRPDAFLMYSNSVHSQKFFECLLLKVDNIKKPLITGLVFKILRYAKVDEYTCSYIHYNLNTGLTDIKDTIDTFNSIRLDLKINAARLRNKDLWPL